MKLPQYSIDFNINNSLFLFITGLLVGAFLGFKGIMILAIAGLCYYYRNH